jgi:hypothetical protein
MLPINLWALGCCVTLEYEYILILRKGPKREFKKEIDEKVLFSGKSGTYKFLDI